MLVTPKSVGKKSSTFTSLLLLRKKHLIKKPVYVLRCCRHLSISWEVLLSKKFFWENAEQLLEFSTEAKGKTLGAKESFERILSKKCPQHELRHGWYWFQPQPVEVTRSKNSPVSCFLPMAS